MQKIKFLPYDLAVKPKEPKPNETEISDRFFYFLSVFECF